MAEPPVWVPAGQHERPSLKGDQVCDLVVIGGGIVGLTAAEYASRHGLRVILVEAAAVGEGASGTNAAGIAPIWGMQTPGGVVAELGPERGDALNRALAASADTLIDRALSLAPESRPVKEGFLALAARQATAERLGDIAEQWRRCGAEVEHLSAALGHYVDSPRYLGGLLFKSGGTFDPLAYMKGLAVRCEQLGATLFEGSPVSRVSRIGDGQWLVDAREGTVRADIAVAAVHGGADLGHGLDQLGGRIECQLVSSAPLTQLQRAALPPVSTFADLDDMSVFGGTMTADGRVVSTVLPGPGRLSLPQATDLLSRKFTRAFPTISPPDWSGMSGGHILMTPKKLPQLIQLGQGFFAGQGCNGYGLCAGTLLGEDLARLALSRDAWPARFPLERARRSRAHSLVSGMVKLAMPLVRRFS
ncbi:MAG: NAD(P)/FAD-dependent oxidoreductase [Pseudomonadota bacterium]|uniref:NAD(P)/FAD-dependent oxidoreductase n=1 Tax=Rhizorhabdus phycosphaerae TaxID=2711156 RepID=UPI0013ED74F1|nr:FAD-binding oxidoreductase [Rhizorhabdus phycosphaerae]